MSNSNSEDSVDPKKPIQVDLSPDSKEMLAVAVQMALDMKKKRDALAKEHANCEKQAKTIRDVLVQVVPPEINPSLVLGDGSKITIVRGRNCKPPNMQEIMAAVAHVKGPDAAKLLKDKLSLLRKAKSQSLFKPGIKFVPYGSARKSKSKTAVPKPKDTKVKTPFLSHRHKDDAEIQQNLSFIQSVLQSPPAAETNTNAQSQ